MDSDSLKWSKQNAKRVRIMVDKVIDGEMVLDELDFNKLCYYCKTLVADLSNEDDVKRLERLKKILNQDKKN
jgi:hypothetical protein